MRLADELSDKLGQLEERAKRQALEVGASAGASFPFSWRLSRLQPLVLAPAARTLVLDEFHE